MVEFERCSLTQKAKITSIWQIVQAVKYDVETRINGVEANLVKHKRSVIQRSKTDMKKRVRSLKIPKVIKSM